MKYCVMCGRQIADENIFCPHCGAHQSAGRSENRRSTAGESHTGLTVLGFIFPIVALIGYFFWSNTNYDKAFAVAKGGLMSLSLNPILGLIFYIFAKDSYPDVAKACGICALVGVGVSVLASVVASVASILYLMG